MEKTGSDVEDYIYQLLRHSVHLTFEKGPR